MPATPPTAHGQITVTGPSGHWSGLAASFDPAAKMLQAMVIRTRVVNNLFIFSSKIIVLKLYHSFLIFTDKKSSFLIKVMLFLYLIF